MALADVVISRAGSNAIFELHSLQKPMLLIPLPTGSSRGEQMLNAKSFEKHGFAKVLADEALNDLGILADKIDEVYSLRKEMIENMRSSKMKQTTSQELFEAIVND
jgi:UDP-N-acetylglucosamine--N-acetylmuramyl-(pentapeptide) pyrophosphoryl-undecaprenol N-acetylglucosamine transferase